MTDILDYPENRDVSFDALRGIAIIAVVSMHAIPWKEYQSYVILSYRQLLNFAVPVFLFISGYWSTKKPISSFVDYKQFLIKRFSRILIPYLFWSVIYLTYEDIKIHDFELDKTIIMHGLWNFTDPLGLVHIPFNVPFLSTVIFYQTGLLMRSHYNAGSIPRSMSSFIPSAILLSATISVQESLMILAHYDNWRMAISPLKYSSFLYFACIIWGFIAFREHFKNWPRLLITLGEYSFGIFLIHMIIIRGINRVLHKIDLSWLSQLPYQFIVIPITLSICFILIHLTRRLLPKPLCSKVLGF